MSPEQIRAFVGQPVQFDHQGKRLSGIVTKAEANGYAEPGHIPDALLTVRGSSGKTLTVSLVESRASFPDQL